MEEFGPVIIIIIAGVIILPVILGTITKGKWGINLDALLNPPKCPTCGNKLPIIRVPKDQRETVWGGWTCEKCGTKIDKWGKKLTSS